MAHRRQDSPKGICCEPFQWFHMILENVPGCIHGEGHSYRTEAEASPGSHCWRWLLLSGANARPSRSPTQTWLELTGRSLPCCGLVCPWRSGHAAWRLSTSLGWITKDACTSSILAPPTSIPTTVASWHC